MRSALALLSLLTLSCATATPPSAPPCNPGHTLVSSTLWVQTAAEYDALALQTFAAARRSLDAALADPSWVGAAEETADDSSQPPAIITDLDETVLDNSAFEARMIRAGMTYDSKSWDQWTAESAAVAVPGAAEFLAYAKSRGVTPFYITNRKADEHAGTLENLRRLGFPSSEETLLVRGEREEWSGRDKAPRRDWVASQYRVLAILGDDLNDFVNTQGADAAQRDALVRQHADKWGSTWFVIPNPVYGSWEDVVAGEGSPCEKLATKVRALQ